MFIHYFTKFSSKFKQKSTQILNFLKINFTPFFGNFVLGIKIKNWAQVQCENFLKFHLLILARSFNGPLLKFNNIKLIYYLYFIKISRLFLDFFSRNCLVIALVRALNCKVLNDIIVKRRWSCIYSTKYSKKYTKKFSKKISSFWGIYKGYNNYIRMLLMVLF